MATSLDRFASKAVVFFIASILLVGCASGGYQVAPSSSTLQRAVPLGLNTSAVLAKPFSALLGGEVFTASNVTVTKKTCGGGLVKSESADFTADGKAKGPYSGSFAAHGSWAWATVPVGGQWGFFEKFKITSGTRTIFGKIVAGGKGNAPAFLTCTTFGPTLRSDGLKFHSWIDGIHYSGPATIRIIESGSLGEMLRR